MPGSFDFDPYAVPLAGNAVPVGVFRYDPAPGGRPALHAGAQRAVRLDPVSRRGRAAGGAVPLRAGRFGRASDYPRSSSSSGRWTPPAPTSCRTTTGSSCWRPLRRPRTACCSTGSPRCPRSS